MKKTIVCLLFSLAACLLSVGEVEVVHESTFRVGGPQIFENIFYPVYSEGEGTSQAFVGYEELSFVTRGRSPIYYYKGPSPLVFFEKETGTGTGSGAAGSSLKPVANVAIADFEEGTYFLFFYLSSRTGNQKKYGVLPVSLSENTLGSGDIILLNGSTKTIAFQSSDNGISGLLVPGKSHILSGRDLPGAVIRVKKSEPHLTDGSGATEAATVAADEIPERFAYAQGTDRVQTIDLAFATRSAAGDWESMQFDIVSAYENEVRVIVFYPPAIEGSSYLRRSIFTFSLSDMAEGGSEAGQDSLRN